MKHRSEIVRKKLSAPAVRYKCRKKSQKVTPDSKIGPKFIKMVVKMAVGSFQSRKKREKVTSNLQIHW
jgi:hypothetical protein